MTKQQLPLSPEMILALQTHNTFELEMQGVGHVTLVPPTQIDSPICGVGQNARKPINAARGIEIDFPEQLSAKCHRVEGMYSLPPCLNCFAVNCLRRAVLTPTPV